MTLVDSSAWVAYFRGADESSRPSVRGLLRSGAPMITTEPVMMELLAGTHSAQRRDHVRRSLARCRQERVRSPDDWLEAAALYQTCRTRGATPRGFLGCLIATVAIRIDVPVLAHDRDFELIARHTPLRMAA